MQLSIATRRLSMGISKMTSWLCSCFALRFVSPGGQQRATRAEQPRPAPELDARHGQRGPVALRELLKRTPRV